VGNGIKMLEAMSFAADDWLDPVAAANAQCETLEGLRTLQATLKAREEEAARLEEQRRQQEAERAELERQAAELRAEKARIDRLQAMVAEIRAAATGHDNASAADLYEARIAVAALDVSEAVYAEFAALAAAAQASTLAVLEKLHGEAEARELAAVRAIVAEPPAATETTEGQDDPQVLKAEPATADATAGSVPADASPRVGATGAEQPAAAGPADDDGPLETGEADARPYVAPLAAAPAPATDPRDEFVALVMSAFDCKFPSHPKPSAAWWAEVRAAGQKLQETTCA